LYRERSSERVFTPPTSAAVRLATSAARLVKGPSETAIEFDIDEDEDDDDEEEETEYFEDFKGSCKFACHSFTSSRSFSEKESL
jgi:hypothetical protein